MLANICTFMLCCFAITLNINTVESGKKSQINPLRFFIQTSREIYVQTLNSLKTFNKHPIVIKTAGQKILSTPGITSMDDYRLKLKSRDKLEKKAEDVKCSFSVVVQSNLSDLKHLLERLKSGESFVNNEDHIKRLKKDAEIIFHALLFGNFETGKWLWNYFLKIIAIRKYYDNKPFIYENLFDDEQLETDVSDVIENCMAEKYLPPNTMESDFISKNISVYNNMMRDLCNAGWLRIDMSLDRDYDALIDFLYLKEFWDNNEILFRQSSEVNVDWSMAKERFELEVDITRDFVENRAWMYNPYGRLDHQYLLIKIIDARIYCHLSVVLYVYEKQLSTLEDDVLTDIKDLMYNVIMEALKLTAFKDECLVAIASEIKFGKIRDVDDIQDILARLREKANLIQNDLNGAGTSGIDWLSYDVDKQQLTTTDLITRIIKDFEDYITEFKGYLSFQYKALLHFTDVVKTAAAPYI